MPATEHIKIEIRDLTMAYGSFVVMRDISAKVRAGEVFVIMGPSGCGKSTLLKHMVGLKEPARGDILYDGKSFWHSSDAERQATLRRFGVLFQSGALWSSMTLEENVALPLGEFTRLSPKEIAAYNKLDMNKGLNLDQVIRIPLNSGNFSQTGSLGTPVYYKVGDKVSAGKTILTLEVTDDKTAPTTAAATSEKFAAPEQPKPAEKSAPKKKESATASVQPTASSIETIAVPDIGGAQDGLRRPGRQSRAL